MTPKVTICVPTYHRAALLGKTLKDMLAQTYSDWELLVCDDASPDNTEEVVRGIADPRVRYYRNETNLGLYANWNHGISLAKGDYVAIYHDHDIYMPTIVERSVTLLDRYPSASFVHTALVMVDENDKPVAIDVRPFPELLSGQSLIKTLVGGWSSPIMAATVMVRRNAYERVGLYAPSRYGLGCDLDMWFRLAQSSDVGYVSEPQAHIRARKKSDSTAQFRWSDVTGSLDMRQDHINLAFGRNSRGYLTSSARFMLQRDIRLLQLMVRAILLESPQIIKEGDAVVQSRASMWVRELVGLVKGSDLLQAFLRRRVLPVHYRLIGQSIQTELARAQQYLAQHDDVANGPDAGGHASLNTGK